MTAKEYVYMLTTEDMTDLGYVVVSSDSAKAIMNYAVMYTRDHPLTHLVVRKHGQRIAVAINGEFYTKTTTEAIEQILEGGEK